MSRKFDQKELDQIAGCIEEYLDIVEAYIIIDGITEEEYTRALKGCRKLVKKLRKGEGEKVFNMERYEAAKAENKVIL